MGKVVVISNLTLDGVMQTPAAPTRTSAADFEHGGWAAPYNDPVMGQATGER